MLPRQATDGGDAFAPHAGGAVFNTSIALGRLGTKTGFFSGLSRDLFGQILEDGLAASHVSTDLCPRSDRPTTLAFVQLTDGQAKYVFYDENTAMRMLRETDLPQLPDTTNALFFGGISLVGEPCGATYEKLMLRAAKTRVTMIDPNIRPGFITDEARYRARLMAMIGAADIVKLSDEDMAWLFADGDGVAQVLDMGAKLVLMTEGSKGASGYTAGGKVFVEAKKVTVADTVGAGDTFNAGVLASLDRAALLDKSALGAITEDAIADALGLGISAAAITVSRAGANPPWASELT